MDISTSVQKKRPTNMKKCNCKKIKENLVKFDAEEKPVYLKLPIDNFELECCDCSLVHYVKIGLVKDGVVGVSFRRADSKTKIARKKTKRSDNK